MIVLAAIGVRGAFPRGCCFSQSSPIIGGPTDNTAAYHAA